MKIAILAGGLARRMHPETVDCPKSLLVVAGRPFIDWQLDYLAAQGLKEVVVCTGHLGEKIEAHVGNGRRFGLRVRYSRDGRTLAGTGGAIKKALPLLGDAFFVMYGDSYLPVEFRPVADHFAARRPPGLMTVIRNRGRWQPGNAQYADGWVVRYDKRIGAGDMEYIDYGLLILTAAAVAGHPGRSFDLAEILTNLAGCGQLAGYEVRRRFYEIGSQAGRRDCQRFLRRRHRLSGPEKL
ncbi:MAG: NTP transferase domain-containing protein [Negativicutes bacterium]|nr:NTP transferase domain-containing protein [Negativicutes bacterium]